MAARKYKELETKANILIGDFKMKQWDNFLNSQGKNPLLSIPFWKRINRLRAGKRRSNISEISHNGIKINDPLEKANLFATELKKKFTLDDNPNFDSNHKKNFEEGLANEQWKNKFSQTQKSYRPFSIDELNGAVKHMNAKTSLDGMGISNRMLKKLGPTTKKEIVNLFNQCLKEEKIPQE